MKAEPSRLIPRTLTENLERLIVVNSCNERALKLNVKLLEMWKSSLVSAFPGLV